MNALEVLTENAQKTDTEVFAQIRSEDSKAEPRSLKAALRKAINTFADCCNRLDMDDRWLWP
jgi:hypothetical protein